MSTASNVTVSTGLPLEIERKYLIEYPDTVHLDCICFSRSEIVQTYLKSDGNEVLRVRKRTENGEVRYYLTSKRRVTDVTRIEEEREITATEYYQKLEEADDELNPIEKTRYCLKHEKLIIEIDVYPFWYDKAIMEIELSSEEQNVSFPSDISVIREVTCEKGYSNYELARQRY